MKSITLIFAMLVAAMMYCNSGFTQDLEPRRWTPLPVDTQVVGVGYGHSNGDISLDPVLKIDEGTVDLDSVVASYVRPFSLAGRLARFDAFIPFHDSQWQGLLDGQPATAQRRGFGDPILRVSVLLKGAPVANEEDLRRYIASHPVRTSMGVGLAVSLPLGDYHDDKLLNIGSNRFSFRPQVGVVHIRGRWSYELTGSVFLFTDNDDFFNSNILEQNPLYAVQSTVVRVFKPGLWMAISAGYGRGGRSTLNGERKDDRRETFLSGLSAGIPLSRNQSLKLAYVSTRR